MLNPTIFAGDLSEFFMLGRWLSQDEKAELYIEGSESIMEFDEPHIVDQSEHGRL